MTHLEQPALPSCEPLHDPPNEYILLDRIQTLEALVRQQSESLRLAQLDIAQRVEYSQQEARVRLALLHTARRLEEQLQESNAEVQRLQAILAAVNAGLAEHRQESKDMQKFAAYWAEVG